MQALQTSNADRGEPVLLLTISTSSEEFHYANRALTIDGIFYDDRIESVGRIRRALDLLQSSLDMSEVRVSLSNAPLSPGQPCYFSVAPDSELLLNSRGVLELGMVANGELQEKTTLYSGLVTPVSLSQQRFEIELRNNVREQAGILQRSVTAAAFPNAPERERGVGLNIILGRIEGNGAAYCALVDETEGAERLVVAQHTCHSVVRLIQQRNGTRTLLNAGNHYTVNSNDSDALGFAVTSITLAAGVHEEGDQYYADVEGYGSSGSLLMNPASAFRQFLINETPLKEDDFDSEQWDAAEALCSQRGYDAAGQFGACIPQHGAMVEAADAWWKVLQQLCQGFNHALTITPQGRIGIRSIDIASGDGSSTASFVPSLGELDSGAVSTDYLPLKVENQVRCTYGINHSSRGRFSNVISGLNRQSSESFGPRESSFANRAFSGRDGAADVLKRRMLLSSGKARVVNWKVPGLAALTKGCDIGDIVSLNEPEWMGGGSRQCCITQISIDPLLPEVSFSGLLLGSAYTMGSISFSEEQNLDLNPAADTWFNTAASGSSYGHSVEIVFSDEIISPGNHTRTAFRFDLSAIPGGASITAASLRLRLTGIRDDSGGSLILRLAALLKADWMESGSYTNVDGAGNQWTDAWFGNQLAPATGVQPGYCTFQFDTNGMQAVTGAIGGDINLTLLPINPGEEVRIASSEHPALGWRPLLTIVYQT